VITAARHDHVSFGCGAKEDLTYFGRAFFERALPKADSLVDAFQIARRIVYRMERAGKFEHSEPQIAWGKAIRTQLDRLEAERLSTAAAPAVER
jgi:hypothetical protein